MYLRRVVAFLAMAAGSGLGVALAAGPAAVAETGNSSPSPVDAWPYTVGGDGVNTLPDLSLYEAGDTVYHDDTPWYTADVTSYGSYYHEEVTNVLDPSFGYPSVGTVADQYTIDIPVNITSQPTDFFDLYSNNYISDPTLGTGYYTTFFDSSFTNFYVSDTAGIEDQVSFFGGQPITLFDFPASDAGSSGAAASELGDGFQQLMTDLIGAAPGPETLADLF